MGLLPYDFSPSDDNQMPLMDPYQFLLNRLVHEQKNDPDERRAAMIKTAESLTTAKAEFAILSGKHVRLPRVLTWFTMVKKPIWIAVDLNATPAWGDACVPETKIVPMGDVSSRLASGPAQCQPVTMI